MTPAVRPDLDLVISRVIKAPPTAIWRAWTDPAAFQKWWIPAPTVCRVVDMDLRPGGAFVTEMSDGGGPFQPHLDACFLAVEPETRIVFTNALTGGWRPAARPWITAVITLQPHPDGTDYSAHVMHKNPADKDKHLELGFHEGWGACIAQLAALVEQAG